MNKILKMSAIAAVLAMASTGAMADKGGRGHGHGRGDGDSQGDYRRADRYERDDRRGMRGGRDGREYIYRDGRRYELRDDDGRNRRYHPNSGKWDNGRRGPPPWAKGRDYRGYGYNNVVIVPMRDYDRYRLYAPQPGYRWMGDNAGHYMLVSIASGIISDVLTRAGL